MKKILLALIALTMTAAAAEAQQKLHVWLKNGTHVSYDVTEVDSIGFYTPSYTLTVTVEGEGTVTGAGQYKMDEQATLTATPATGYMFSQWSDGKTDNTRVVTMTKDLTLTAVFIATGGTGGGPAGGIGAFSVSATEQVTFSPGNLQYNAAQGSHRCADGTTKQGTWRFAEHQWDMVGMGYGQTNTSDSYRCYIGGTVQNGDNRNISSSYNGWIDLFGWGTSGWNSGANAYQPWSTSETSTDYTPGNNSSNNLTGNYANADWGVYNQIGDDDPGTWRTLTYNEWDYLIYTRTNASSKYSAAKVNGMTGMVILPDVFTLPAGCGFTAGMTSASNWYDWSYVNTTNIYTSTQWQLMEAAGAVFLPASGGRFGASVDGTGVGGCYWSSTAYSQDYACYLRFYSADLGTYYGGRLYAQAVRLVRVVQN